MRLRKEWKTFVRVHSLGSGDVLLFKLVAVDMVSVKFFGASGGRLGCCVESSSDSGSCSDTASSSSDSDEEDSVGSL
jgi:hypothetical protein